MWADTLIMVFLNSNLDESVIWFKMERKCALHWERFVKKLWNRFIFLFRSSDLGFLFVLLFTFCFLLFWLPMHLDFYTALQISTNDTKTLLIAINTSYALLSCRLNPARELQRQCWCLWLCLPSAGCPTTFSTCTARSRTTVLSMIPPLIW